MKDAKKTKNHFITNLKNRNYDRSTRSSSNYTTNYS